MKKPNFFIVGAAKAGTTSLYNYLKQNNQIFFPEIKEPHFFFKEVQLNSFRDDFKIRTNKKENKHQAFITEEQVYLDIYKDVSDEVAIGDASASYLYSKVAPQEIFEFNNQSKILIILRQPIERAFSHYLMNLRMGFAKGSFKSEFIEDVEKKEKGWGISHLYLELGLYFEQVKRYLEVFPKNQVKLIRHEDLKNNTSQVLSDIDKFLGVKNNFTYKVNETYNSAALPRSKGTIRLIRNLNLRKLLPHSLIKLGKKTLYTSKGLPKLSNEDRSALMQYFYQDIKKLEKLIDIDLHDWYEE